MSETFYYTIFDSFLSLVKSGSVSEDSVLELRDFMDEAERRKLIQESSPYWPATKIISDSIFAAERVMARKRVHKFADLKCSASFLDYLNRLVGDANVPIPRLSEFDWDNASSVATNSVRDFDFLYHYLNKVLIPTSKLREESTLERYLFDLLAPTFGPTNIHRQYHIGGFLGLKSDLDFYNWKYGVGLKVDAFSATVLQRLIGQTTYYSQRVYGKNLIIFVVGKGVMDATMAELGRFIEELGVKFIYRKAVVV